MENPLFLETSMYFNCEETSDVHRHRLSSLRCVCFFFEPKNRWVGSLRETFCLFFALDDMGQKGGYIKITSDYLYIYTYISQLFFFDSSSQV